jgi:hypothetical protein
MNGRRCNDYRPTNHRPLFFPNDWIHEMICNVDICDSTELVYSGVDAFLLGLPTEKYCYECASNGYAHKTEMEINA